MLIACTYTWTQNTCNYVDETGVVAEEETLFKVSGKNGERGEKITSQTDRPADRRTDIQADLSWRKRSGHRCDLNPQPQHFRP